MESGLFAYLFCLGLLVILTAGIAVRALIHWRKPGARTLGFLMLSMAVWAGFYVMEILLPSLPEKVIARKILYLGMTMSPPLWLGFALRYTGFNTWWSQRGRVFLLAIPGLIAFLMGITNEQHHLIWESISLPEIGTGALILDFGSAFWIFTGIAYTLIGIGILVYILAYLQSGKSVRIKTGVMLLGASLTALANAFFLFSDFDLAVDPTPLSFLFSAPLFAFGFFRFGTAGVLPLTAQFVIDHFQDHVIVLNEMDQVSDMNHAARDLFQIQTIPEEKSVFEIFPEASLLKDVWDMPDTSLKMGLTLPDGTNWYEARVIPLQEDDLNLIGRVIVLHDITSEQNLLKGERRRSQQLALLEEIGRSVADSLNEQEILQRAVEAIIQRFGYALACISVLTKDNMLEAVVIAGTKDFGYQPGYKQPIGSGIIGHTAAIQKTYLSKNVSQDPYYFSNRENFGSAICTPILKQGRLYGVLYVESLEANTFDNLDVKTLETLASQISGSLQRADLYAETRENLRVLAIMQNISKVISSSLEMEVIAEKVVNSLCEAFGYTHASIYLLDDDYLHLAGEVGYPAEMTINKIHISQGVSGRAIRTRTVQFIEDTSREDVFLKADHNITSEICIPLMKDNTVLGTLNVESDGSRKLAQADVNWLTTLAGPIAVAVDNARLHAQIKKLATTDAVTGLANRHVFEQTLAAEVERAQRTNAHVSLIIFDLDSFKEYNDKWGHPAGDARLKAMGNIVKGCLRKYDIAARYGGDEFAIILSNSNEQESLAFAKRLHDAAQAGAEESPQEGLGIPGYTLSIGIATFPNDATTQAELLLAADNAALRAKHLGKNRIQLASDMHHGSA